MGRLLLKNKKTGAEKTFSESLALEAIRGGDWAPVQTETIVLPDGTVSQADPELIETQLRTGAVAEDEGARQERYKEQLLKEKFDQGIVSDVDAFLGGAADMASLGVTGLLRSEEERQSARLTAKYSPRARFLGELAALAVPTGRYTPLGALTKGARKVGTKAERAVIAARGKSSPVLSRIAKHGAEGAVEGTGIGVGTGLSELALSDDPLTVENIVGAAAKGGGFGLASGAIFGGGAGGAIGILKRRAGKAVAHEGRLLAAEKEIVKDIAEVSADTATGRAVIGRTRSSVEALEMANKEVRADLRIALEAAEDMESTVLLKELKKDLRNLDRAEEALTKHLGKGEMRNSDEQLDFVLFKSSDGQLKRFQRSLRDYHNVTKEVAQNINSRGMDGLDDAISRLTAESVDEGGILKKMDMLDAAAAADMMGIADISDFSGDLGPVAELLIKGRAFARHGATLAGKVSPIAGRVAEEATERIVKRQTTPSTVRQILGGAIGSNISRKYTSLAQQTKGAQISFAGRVARDAIGQAQSRAVRNAVAGGVSVQRAAIKQQAQARKAVKQFLVGRKVARQAPRYAGLIGVSFALGDKRREKPKGAVPNASKVGVEFLRVQEELSKAMASPEATRMELSKRFEAIRYINARTFDQVVDTAFKQMAWLHGQLPRNPGMGSATNAYAEWIPPDSEIVAFTRKARVVANPLEALERFKEGSISLDEVMALRAAYPNLYDDIVQEVVRRLPELKKELDYDKRVALSIMTGVPVDSTMRRPFVEALKAMHAESQGQEQQGAQPATPKYKPTTIAKEMAQEKATNAQRLSASS